MGAPYIYDISTLRVNNLTFILLTCRKWLAPNNASRQQMGFNSGFKGLRYFVFVGALWGKGLNFSLLSCFEIKVYLRSFINYINTDSEGRPVNFSLLETKDLSDDKLNNIN